MKTVKQIMICALLLLPVQNGFTEEPVLTELDGNDHSAQINQPASQQQVEEEQKIGLLEQQAWQQFCLAKISSGEDTQSEAYANAIKYISDAAAVMYAPPSTFLLGSRIYRHKGGISFAKNYFSRAAAGYLDEAMQQPESIQANLNAAIILYAGDVRYWESYEESKKNAWNYADKVLALCKKAKSEKNPGITEELFLEEAAALAFLVKENIAQSSAHFAKAEKLWGEETVKTNSALIKFFRPDNLNASAEAGSYKPYELFKAFPEQGKWYWRVASQPEAGKEFLLTCLTGFVLEQ